MSPSSPTVSVILPTYRRWPLLCEALESVLGQTFADFEVVVVNDAGGPPSTAAAALLGAPRVRYVEHEVNRGLAAARNTGIANSAGRYLAYLDDDDLYYPKHLETLAGALTARGWDVVHADAYEGQWDAAGPRRLDRRLVYTGALHPDALWTGNKIPVLAVMHRRECLDRTGGFDPSLRLLEDWDLWLRMSWRYAFHHVPAVTAEYRVWSSMATTSTAASPDSWLLTTCAIYGKCLRDHTVMTDSARRRHLRNAVSRFVRRHAAWFAGPRLDIAQRDVLRAVLMGQWVRMLVRQPRVAAALAVHQFR